MAEASLVNEAIDQALQLASRCAAQETSDNYGALEDQVGFVEDQAREAVQSKLDMASLLVKLLQSKPLAPADLKTLELLVVGEAESYLKYETEFNHWKDELKRVLGEIATLRAAELDVDSLMHLRALCREARECLADMAFYLDAKERVGRFQQATRGAIDADGYRVLAEIVKQMLVSDKM